ncbi:hypothetical protein JTE90_024183 [Oedothorax gibbosus]|uniref:Uncharacterized protein n=1 Tax=Oedothorax gibbosus TaxID=931172 RepID=A0AAV6UCZ3_9ARAC|nr:hypothetical protein JTE90_024183 [Oedothorax gibbosus]
MDSTPGKPESAPRYFPFLDAAGLWPGAAGAPISPFLIGRDMPHFWPVPWLHPHLWSPAVKPPTADKVSIVGYFSEI